MGFHATFYPTFILLLSLLALFATCEKVPQDRSYANSAASRHKRQTFAFPDGESPTAQGLGRSRSRHGFDWDAEEGEDTRRPYPTQNELPDDDEGPNWSFVFDDEFRPGKQRSTTRRSRVTTPRAVTSTQRALTSTVAIPGMGTARSPCEDRCLTTPQYNPVCGNDGMTYFNKERLNCAQRCGKNVDIAHLGACPRRV